MLCVCQALSWKASPLQPRPEQTCVAGDKWSASSESVQELPSGPVLSRRPDSRRHRENQPGQERRHETAQTDGNSCLQTQVHTSVCVNTGLTFTYYTFQ